MEFRDRPVATDDTRNVQALNGLSGKPADGLHNVYGLTHANPVFQLSAAPRAIADGRGQICAVPDISLSLGFSELVVYLAKELTDGCRRDIIRAHEQEHTPTSYSIVTSRLRTCSQPVRGGSR